MVFSTSPRTGSRPSRAAWARPASHLTGCLLQSPLCHFGHSQSRPRQVQPSPPPPRWNPDPRGTWGSLWRRPAPPPLVPWPGGTRRSRRAAALASCHLLPTLCPPMALPFVPSERPWAPGRPGGWPDAGPAAGRQPCEATGSDVRCCSPFTSVSLWAVTSPFCRVTDRASGGLNEMLSEPSWLAALLTRRLRSLGWGAGGAQ